MPENKEKIESVDAEKTEQVLDKKGQQLEDQLELDNNSNDIDTNSIANADEDYKFISLFKFIEAGVHLGLKANKWNPKMKDYIYYKKFNHIIDIKKTVVFLQRAFNFLTDLVKSGGEVMFVGTKNKLARNVIKKNAIRVNSFYVIQRWLGGTLTNFKVISHSIKKLNDLEALLADEEKKSGYTKKELVKLTKEKEKLEKFYGGIKNLKKLPQALVILNPIDDDNALKEAKKVGIPVIAVANTNANPDLIDFIIPANNFSLRSVYLIINVLADAIAHANNEPTIVAFKKTEEIELPEAPRRTINTQKRFTHQGFGVNRFQHAGDKKNIFTKRFHQNKEEINKDNVKKEETNK